MAIDVSSQWVRAAVYLAALLVAGAAFAVPDANPNPPGPEDLPEAHAEIAKMHSRFVEEFIEAEGFGVRRMMPVVPPPVFELKFGEHRYTVEKRELVSLLKAEDPAVYVEPPSSRDGFPKGLAAAPGVRRHSAGADDADRIVRPLTGFESKALSRLRAGRDVVIEFRDGPPKVMGAIRAQSQCVRCHGGQEDDLLGALVYDLKPAAHESGDESGDTAHR